MKAYLLGGVILVAALNVAAVRHRFPQPKPCMPAVEVTTKTVVRIRMCGTPATLPAAPGVVDPVYGPPRTWAPNTPASVPSWAANRPEEGTR